MNNMQECIDCCNQLLRGELSAVETYDQALEKFDSSIDQETLNEIRADHERSAAVLSEHILSMGGTPAEDSGAWGAFAKAVEGGAKLLGESPALKALQEGEEYGVSEYEDALANSKVMEEIKAEIRSTLLPELSQHIALLKGLRED